MPDRIDPADRAIADHPLALSLSKGDHRAAIAPLALSLSKREPHGTTHA